MMLSVVDLPQPDGPTSTTNSPSSIKQAYGKASYRKGPAEVNLSAIHADNRLVGNGMVPVELYRENPTAIFTSPDESLNKLTHLNLQGAYNLDDTFNVVLKRCVDIVGAIVGLVLSAPIIAVGRRYTRVEHIPVCSGCCRYSFVVTPSRSSTPAGRERRPGRPRFAPARARAGSVRDS